MLLLGTIRHYLCWQKGTCGVLLAANEELSDVLLRACPPIAITQPSTHEGGVGGIFRTRKRGSQMGSGDQSLKLSPARGQRGSKRGGGRAGKY